MQDLQNAEHQKQMSQKVVATQKMRSSSKLPSRTLLSSMKKAMPLVHDIIFTKSTSFRKRQIQNLRNIIDNWRTQYKQRHDQKMQQKAKRVVKMKSDHSSGKKTLEILLQESKLFISWLLSFYVLLFFFVEYSFLKGFDPVLPFLKNLFETPFLIFFAAFLFLLSLTVTVCDQFLHNKKFFLLLTSFSALTLLVMFVINF